ncbi:MAG TPA: S46 family peptidase [Bacteroidales bacterium]|nr:S46 family peptidase [Bacteroidales bacterium]
MPTAPCGSPGDLISDWQYDYELQRAITADIRYVLFVTEKFGHAGFILDEMGFAH